MLSLLWLIPTLPLAGFLVLALSGRYLGHRSIAVIGTSSVALSALIAILIGIDFIAAPPPGFVYRQEAWTWIAVAGFSPGIGFYLDALSLVMVLVVTVISFLIHLYSTEFMSGDEGYARFFAYMNLFVGSMCILVLADNLLFLYLGWEGVGLCSYLLIGFWYRDPVNGRAARKAFIVTRIGDTAMAIGLFLLFTHLGTLDIQPLMQRAGQQWPEGSELAILAAALLLAGAVGKSAQLPLQTWLPDAMAGPTPVSALIHAATMVTAGVYLIARTHALFTLAPVVQLAVAVIGALTLLLAGFSAFAQKDIKRVLAYSTISQIGYMFLALGVGAWSAAIFHLMTHAFFKALLFLSAGVVIMSLHEEHNIFRMGALRKKLPVAFWTFLIG
ncbi:MAG: NADH-quinone oxidoreductase subunit L, partial [Nitrosospira sp.]